jgi:hypothetical protein
MLGIVKDYLAIARGTLAVGAGAVAAHGRSMLSAATTHRPTSPSELLSCGPRSDEGLPADQAESGTGNGSVKGIGRLARPIGLAPMAELDALRHRLAHLEGQLTHLMGTGQTQDSEPIS